MELQPGTRLGPYEIAAKLGAGGMGEVYRAKDTRLGREVAVKVLPEDVREQPDRLMRFEREARAAGALNHTNVLSLYDVGTHDGAPYAVTELLEGETLRERLNRGPMPFRRAIEVAMGLAQGLGAAHGKGIVHRDLKPENVFLTGDGVVKILDFGIAKLQEEGTPGLAETLPGATPRQSPVPSGRTTPGAVIGTVGYMAPEQARGKEADARSDLFALGVILCEMLTGVRAFPGATPADAMSAILRAEPEGLAQLAERHGVALDRLLRRCLEKDVDRRFQSARDLAFALEPLAGGSSVSTPSASRTPRTPKWVLPALFGTAVGVAAITHFADPHVRGAAASPVEPAASQPGQPSFSQLTFRRGEVTGARFAGSEIVFSADWEGGSPEVYAMVAGGAQPRDLGAPGADLLAVSRRGDVALQLDSQRTPNWDNIGTLAIQPFGGGAPRSLVDGVHYADFASNGTDLAVVTVKDGTYRLEYPAGTVLYATGGWISHPRFSPDGTHIAFLDHPWPGDDRGNVALIDLKGQKSTLSSGWDSLQGLAWSPHGEVWFTAAQAGTDRALYGVSLQGASRLLLRVPGSLLLEDIDPNGRVLLKRDEMRVGMMGLAPGSTVERELTWFDWSIPSDITPDGTKVLFSEQGEAGGPNYSTFLRGTDGSPAVLLGDGSSGGLSPDGAWALATTFTPPALWALPTGTGAREKMSTGDLQGLYDPAWLPDGHRLVFMATDPQAGGDAAGDQYFVVSRDGGVPTAFTPKGVRAAGSNTPVSPDGRFIVAQDPNEILTLYPIDGGTPSTIPGVVKGETVDRFTADGRSVYVYPTGQQPVPVDRVDLKTGTRTHWKTVGPQDLAGIVAVQAPLIAADGKSYVYSYTRSLSSLYLVDGVR
jgi:Tol biopolymer transport system component